MAQRVLVVDDEMHLAKILQFTLNHAGYEASLAYDGKEALEALERESFDLVILDLMLPLVDGYKVCNRIKSDESLKHIPVIILSARDFEREVLDEPLDADILLQKPFNIEVLLGHISSLLQTV
ncbi:MAG: response regulator [Candidatus Krumholzibacteria bacterium]|nr:response regulator [Candidatus Krumholzibacteria bacterium]